MKQQTISERDLIARAQRGNPEAFGDLYKLHLDAIYRYVHSRVGETSEAENLTQTIFVKAWRALENYRPTQVPFRAWLYRIAHNAVVDYYRTKKNSALLEEQTMLSDPSATPEESLISQERHDTLKQAMTKLKPAYQQVLSLRFLNELDYSETADVLGRKVNAVRVLQYRALKALRRVLTQEHMVS